MGLPVIPVMGSLPFILIYFQYSLCLKLYVIINTIHIICLPVLHADGACILQLLMMSAQGQVHLVILNVAYILPAPTCSCSVVHYNTTTDPQQT